jgi:predicted DNA-binding transcriptional regulator AlpA
MQEYEFTLKFNFTDASINPESYLDNLAQAGCDDALIGIGQKGRIALNFNREADSALTALYSAIEQVKSVIPDAQLIEATPDFVGLSDIAEVVGYSRQNIRKLMLNNQASFPPPIHEGSSAIWHLASVLDWFKEGKGYAIDDSLRDLANATMQLNLAKESFKLDPVIGAKFNAVLS